MHFVNSRIHCRTHFPSAFYLIWWLIIILSIPNKFILTTTLYYSLSCAAMHLPVALSFAISPVKPCFKPIFSFFNDLSKTMVRVLYIVCVFTITCIQLPYLQCIPRGVHRVRMSSFCVKDTVCFHVLIHELVIPVSFFTDIRAVPCISTSGSIARGVIHETGCKKFKRQGHVYMILGMHCSSL